MAKTDPAKWGPEHRFTPDEYEAYSDAPRWMMDSPDFVDKDQYHEHWTSTILDWLQQAKQNQSKWKATCQDAVRRVEEYDDAMSRSQSFENTLAYKHIAIAKAYIEENVALLCVNPPSGTLVSMQESLGPYTAASNQICDAEHKANSFEQVLSDIVYDIAFYRIGWIKNWVDYDQYGPYGQKGRIRIDKRDPDDIYVDPRAKRLDWAEMTYIIEESEHEIGEIREVYPISGFDVADNAVSSQYSGMMDERAQDTITSPIAKMDRSMRSKRQRIKVYECWFKDTRLKFVPEREDRETFEPNPITGQMEPQIESNALKLDENGYVIGNWVQAYPNGRCVVICEGNVMEDMPNRLPHGECPYVPVVAGPSRNIFNPGIATSLIIIGDKLNDLIGRIHEFAQSETTRPMEAEIGTFMNAQHYKKVPNTAKKVLLLGQGKSGTFNRRPATEVPQATWQLIQQYQQLMDLVSGSSAIMRGTISDGAQMSAEAMSALQQFASSRVAVKAKYLASAVKREYRQIFWLVRRVYDEKIKVQCTLPDGQSMTVDWESDKQVFESGDEQAINAIVSREEFLFELRSGTGTPNAMQAQRAEADKLFNMGALDVPALLDAYQYPNREQIAPRVDKRAKDYVAAEALGRKLGMSIVKAEKAAEKPEAGKEKF